MASEYDVERAEAEINGGMSTKDKVGSQKKKFMPAPDVEKMAKKLIENYHSILREAKIKYIFRDGTWNKDGKPCPGEAKKMSPLVNALTGIDFGIVINYKYWEAMTSVPLKEAILDHILTHCTYTEDKEGNPKWIVQKPPCVEFPSIVERYGSYNEEMKFMEEAFNNHAKSGKPKIDFETEEE